MDAHDQGERMRPHPGKESGPGQGAAQTSPECSSEQHSTRPEALENFRRAKLAYDHLVRTPGSTARALDVALAALNEARAALQFLAEIGR